MKYEGEMGRIQRALAQCHDAVVRRTTIMDSLNLRTGERSLKFGCGGGFYAYEAAQFVGPTGQVRAVDLSEDQIAAARERCADLPWNETALSHWASKLIKPFVVNNELVDEAERRLGLTNLSNLRVKGLISIARPQLLPRRLRFPDI